MTKLSHFKRIFIRRTSNQNDLYQLNRESFDAFIVCYIEMVASFISLMAAFVWSIVFKYKNSWYLEILEVFCVLLIRNDEMSPRYEEEKSRCLLACLLLLRLLLIVYAVSIL